MEERIVRVDATDADTLVFIVDGKEERINARDFVKIDDTRLEEQLQNNPAEYAYYSAVVSWYQYMKSLKEMQLDIEMAKRDTSVREMYRRIEEKPREADIKTKIDLTDDIIKRREELIQLGYVCKRLEAFVRAVEKKR